MARVVISYGGSTLPGREPGSIKRVREFGLDCGCKMRVDLSSIVRGYYSESESERSLEQRLRAAAEAHSCDIEFIPAAERPEPRARPPEYSMDLVTSMSRIRDTDLARQEVVGEWTQPRRSPNEVERAMRDNPPPRQNISADIQKAADKIQGASADFVVIDEVVQHQSPSAWVPPMWQPGPRRTMPPEPAKPAKPAKPPDPEPKKEEPKKLDRFELIELE